MLAKIFAVIFLIIIAVFLYDFLQDFLNWFGRIKIGQQHNDELWINSLREVNLRWASRGAPSVPKNENQRLKLVDDIKNIKKTTSIAYWQEAAVLKATTPSCGDDAAESAINLIERFIDAQTGEWKIEPMRVDCAILAYEMMSNEFVDNADIKPAMDYVAEMLKENYNQFGFIPYNAGIPNIAFVDTVGMVCPFLIKYAVEYKAEEYIKIAIEQIADYRKNGFDSETDLPFHCFDRETEARLGIVGWGRGCAWWAVGITDSLKELLKADGFNKEKTLLLKLNLSFLEEMEKHITQGGAVKRMVLTESLQDSSASAMLAYCYAYMYGITQKDEYYNNAKKITEYLKFVTRRSGLIDFAQGDTMGIGYYSPKLCVVPASQGFALAAIEELNK